MCAQRATASAEGREGPPRPRLKRSDQREPKTGRGEPTGPRAQDGAREEHTKPKEEGDESRTREHLKRSDRREPKANDAAHATDDHAPTTDTHHTPLVDTPHPNIEIHTLGGGHGGRGDRPNEERERGASAGRPPKNNSPNAREGYRSARTGALMGRGHGGRVPNGERREGPPKHSRPDYNRHYG